MKITKIPTWQERIPEKYKIRITHSLIQGEVSARDEEIEELRKALDKANKFISDYADNTLVESGEGSPSPEVVRECVQHLKTKFIGWKKPSLELPSENCIVDVVTFILSQGKSEAKVPSTNTWEIIGREWLAKTEWVQDNIETFPTKSFGMHRADVMRDEIERLRALLAFHRNIHYV